MAKKKATKKAAKKPRDPARAKRAPTRSSVSSAPSCSDPNRTGGNRGSRVRKADYPWIAADLRRLATPLEKLQPDPENARTHDQKNLAAIEASLKRFGQRKPIVVNRKTGTIEAGNGTLEAARRLGWSHLAVVWVEDDPATARGFSVADNRSAELADWDLDVLLAQTEPMRDDPSGLFDLLLLGAFDSDDEPEKPAEDEPQAELFEVVVQCKSKTDQKRFCQRMRKEGRYCRLE